MEPIQSKCRFEELRVYQDAIEWAGSAYTLSRQWPRDEVFGLTSQWRRASTSTALNIAEGSARGTKEFCRFLEIARASCFECVAIITLAKNQGYLTDTDFANQYNASVKLARQISALKASLEKSSDS